ncbi:MAG: FAD-binding oxidoreductase [Spirochaetaceae bacterium]|jgi:D-lactate dehydrogenase (cytochrome)|nr:FAD-binding oxidoreductase [Spirochaetaceae bacterium]
MEEFIPAHPGYHSYFHDESRLSGAAEYIAFPETAAEAAAAILRAAGERLPITIQGARTGIAGGAVPQGGLILSTERMNRPLGFSAGGVPALRVQAGMSFDALGSFLNRSRPPEDWDAEGKAAFREFPRNLRFPPNPTEPSATLGGAFGCNAQGPNFLRWDAAGDHVRSLVWITPQGEVWNIDRGRYRFDEAGCPLPDGGRLSYAAILPAGGSRFLHPRPGLDLVDFLAGSEGRAGFAAELTLSLQPAPAASWGVVYFFEYEESALDFAGSLREWRNRASGVEALSTLEYYDRSSLELVRRLAPQSAALRRLPPLDPSMAAAVQVELEGDDDEALESLLMEQLAVFLAAGGREEDTWAAASPAELEKFRLLRHAVPELVNTEIDRIRRELPELRKTAADYQVPPETAADYCKTCRRDLEEAGLRGLIFGHIAGGRLHINLLPGNGEELRRGRGLLDRWAALAVQSGGLLAAENGIGRLKQGLLARHLSLERREQISGVLRALDPWAVLGGLDFAGD